MPPALKITLTQNDPKKALNYNANIRAFLGRYVKGNNIDNEAYMKSWKEEVFELRVQNQPRKQRIRIFGAFGRADTFIAFFRKPRDWFGGKEDPRWDECVYRVRREWDEMFPGCLRVPARPFSNCLTFNFIDVYE